MNASGLLVMRTKKVVFSDIDQCIVDIREVIFSHVRHSAQISGIDVMRQDVLHLHSFGQALREHPSVYDALLNQYGIRGGREAHQEGLELETAMFQDFSRCGQNEFDEAQPFPCVVPTYNTLIEQGLTIIGLTARAENDLPNLYVIDGINRTKNWVKKFNIPFHDIFFGRNKYFRVQDWKNQNPNSIIEGIVEDEPSKVVSLAGWHRAESWDFKIYVPRTTYNREILDPREGFLQSMGRNYEEAQATWTRALKSGRVEYIDSVEELSKKLLR
jgi:hypothetical protein